jgi:hypothetical protein
MTLILTTVKSVIKGRIMADLMKVGAVMKKSTREVKDLETNPSQNQMINLNFKSSK